MTYQAELFNCSNQVFVEIGSERKSQKRRKRPLFLKQLSGVVVGKTGSWTSIYSLFYFCLPYWPSPVPALFPTAPWQWRPLPIPSVYRHTLMCSFENLLVGFPWNRKERRWYRVDFIKNIYTWANDSISRAWIVCFLLGAWQRAHLYKLSSAWWGSERIWKWKDMEEFPQDVSIWTVFILQQYCSRRKMF